MDSVIRILFIGLAIQFFVGVCLRWAFLRRVKFTDPDRWEAFGRPTFLPAGNADSTLQQFSYLLKSEYRLSNDKVLIRLASLYRAVLIFYLLYFLAVVVVMIIFLTR
jgi:hypothetical protein